MPQDVVDDPDVWTVTVQVAADGDAVNGDSQLLFGQDLGDRTAYIHKRTLGPAAGTGLWYPTPLVDYGADQISNFITDLAINAYQQNGTGGVVDFYAAPLVLPPTGRIIEVAVLAVGNGAGGGPHAGLPAVLPTLEVFRNDYINDGVNSVPIGSVTDPSLTKEAYDAPHWIRLPSLAQDINGSACWTAKVTGEGGANSITLALQINTIRALVVPAP